MIVISISSGKTGPIYEFVYENEAKTEKFKDVFLYPQRLAEFVKANYGMLEEGSTSIIAEPIYIDRAYDLQKILGFGEVSEWDDRMEYAVLRDGDHRL